MSLTYYCSKCAAKISYLTEKPKNCPKCRHSFGGALETATKRAEVIAAQQVSIAGKTKSISLVDEEEDLVDFEEQELERLEKAKKLKKRKKANELPIRRFNAEDDMEEIEAGDDDPEEHEEEFVDPRAKKQLKRQFLQTLGGDSGFRIEGNSESTTLRSIIKEGGQ